RRRRFPHRACTAHPSAKRNPEAVVQLRQGEAVARLGAGGDSGGRAEADGGLDREDGLPLKPPGYDPKAASCRLSSERRVVPREKRGAPEGPARRDHNEIRRNTGGGLGAW